jgi:rubrerythrin
MSVQLQEKPILEQYKVRFGEEYICLKCGKISREKSAKCPSCGGAICVRIISKF